MMLLWRGGEISFKYGIDLSHLPELDYLEVGEEAVRIGAMTRLDRLDRAADGTTVLDLLGETARRMCTPQTRTLATIGGNICRAAPSADLALPLLVLEAEVKLRSLRGDRVLALESFFTGVGTTDCREDELVVEITVPVDRMASGGSYQRVSRTRVDISLVGAAALLLGEGGEVHQVRIALGAVAPTPIRVRVVEDFIRGKKIGGLTGEELKRVEELASSCASPLSDQRSGAEYRRKMCGVLVRRAVESCLEKLEER